MSKIRLGINNCFAVKRWPEPEEWCRIIAQELGLKYVQFTFDLLDPRVPQPIKHKITKTTKKIAEDYGLVVYTTFFGLAFYSYNQLLHPDIEIRQDALHCCEEAIFITKELGARATGGPLGSLSMKDFSNPSRKNYLTNQLIESLQHLSQVAALEGLEFLLWEPTPLAREITHTMEEAKDFYRKVNEGAAIPIKFCLDVGHQCAVDTEGEDKDPYAWLREFASISPVIHIQQTDGKLDTHWPFTEEYNKKGIIEPEKIVRAIEDSGADEVFLFLEILHPFEADEKKVLEDIRESVAYWKRCEGVDIN